MNVEFDETQIKNAMLKAIAKTFRQRMQDSSPLILNDIKAKISERIFASPEYMSLVTKGGMLYHEMGSLASDQVAREVIQKTMDNMYFKPTPVRVLAGEVLGGATIGIIKSGYEDLLSITNAEFISDVSGLPVYWLEWLLTAGDTPVVFTHRYEATQSPRSRTGLGLMVKGGVWRVPPVFSGVPGDNWLTRALESIDKDITEIFRKHLS